MDRYSFLLTAMSMAEAKETLGFSPDSRPTPNEIKEAYRRLALKVHPDVGGDPKAMENLNVAKDILEGKARPTYERPTAPEPPKKREVTFEQAESKAGIPGDVEWMFVTPLQRGTSWASDESAQSNRTFVAYGRTDRQHVFVAAHYYYRQDFYVGGTNNEEIWTVKSIKLPIKKDEGVQPRWLYGNVVKALKAIGFKGRFNSKVIDAQGWRLDDKLPRGSETSIKHWLVNSGQVEGTSPSVAGRKQVVEIEIGGTYDKRQLVLSLNGKPYTLSDRDQEKAEKARLLEAIFGTYYYGGSKKIITRLRKGKKILGWMIENLRDLPDVAIEVLKAAEAQMK